MKVVEIAFTGYPVTDMQRARGFYEGVLKLEPTRTVESPRGEWIEYDLKPSTFAISNMSQDDWKASGAVPVIAFEVDEFDSAVSALRDNSVKFVVEPFENSAYRMAIIAGPDGNSICIHKRHVR